MKKLIVSIISFLRARTKVVAILLALVGLLGLSPLAMAEDPVYFADANLKAAVEDKLGITDPTPTDMLLLTHLNANYSEIVDLTGIEYATNLTGLYLSDNQISDISPLSGLTNLMVLFLASNPLSVEAYCIYLPLIEDNNPGIDLTYDPSPYSDSDDDGTPDACDNCPETPNPNQLDTCPDVPNDCGSAPCRAKLLHWGCSPGEICAKFQGVDYLVV